MEQIGTQGIDQVNQIAKMADQYGVGIISFSVIILLFLVLFFALVKSMIKTFQGITETQKEMLNYLKTVQGDIQKMEKLQDKMETKISAIESDFNTFKEVIFEIQRTNQKILENNTEVLRSNSESFKTFAKSQEEYKKIFNINIDRVIEKTEEIKEAISKK